MSKGRCVDCGFFTRQRVNDGSLLTLGEYERANYSEDSGQLDSMLRCYMEFEGFAWEQVRETIDCPFYMRRIPNLSPVEHLEMQQVLEARQQAAQAAASQRREARIIATITITLTVAAVIVAALIGRGLILGP